MGRSSGSGWRRLCRIAVVTTMSTEIASLRYLSLFSLSLSLAADVSKNYNFKVSLEHQLPTASQKLRTTDECVVSSLISLVTCTGKVRALEEESGNDNAQGTGGKSQ